jgi:membrane peptidoglycan carboxypeptidase
MSMKERFRTMPARWKQRRIAKKRRLARMSRKRRILRRLGISGTWLLGLVAAFMAITVLLFYTLTNVPRPESLALAKTVRILYSDGTLMAERYTQNRTIISLNEVPDQVRWDVLAAEDRGFYSEPGISLRGTARALITDLTGGDTQGGSGITQQYVKNAYLNNSRSITRKVKELMIAVKLSRQYSKDQILEFYLNTIYFGRGAYGIQAAAQTYFHTDVSKLTVSQGAVLAALLRAPSYYDPANNLDAAKARWQYVLDGMVSTGHLTKDQEGALTYPKVDPPHNDTALGGPTEFIVNQVLAELHAMGISDKEMYDKGLTVQTTIDRTAQTDAVNAISKTFATLTAKQRNLKNALVAVDPATGAVLAYYGGPNGRNYSGHFDYVDYAGVGSRPAGSSFKPYTLATVLQQSLSNTPDATKLSLTSYVDGSYCAKIQGHQICNDPGDQSVSSSSIRIKDALKYSLNTTFDELAVQVGPNSVAALAHAAGISKTDANGNPTLVDKNGDTGFDIGIGGYAVHPLDQAVGFATFANGGTTHPAYFVQKITDDNGVIIFNHKVAGKRAMDAKVANDVTLAMEPIAAYSNDGLSVPQVSAAKTGTQGIPGTTANSDAWMVGFTPQVSVAVWTGSGDSVTPIYNSYGAAEYGSDLPGKTWKLFLDTYLAGKPVKTMPTTQMIGGGINLARVPPSPTPSKSKTATSSPTSSASPTPSDIPPTFLTPTPTPTPKPACTPTLLSPCLTP